MNTTTKCPVCPLEDVPPTALQCPNCKTDLTLLRRLETLPDSFARDAETLRDTDPRGALRALHTALSLEPQNEAYQRRVREAEGVLDEQRTTASDAASTEAQRTLPTAPIAAANKTPSPHSVTAASPTSLNTPTSVLPVPEPPANKPVPSRRSGLPWALTTAASAMAAFFAGTFCSAPSQTNFPASPKETLTVAHKPPEAIATPAAMASASTSPALAVAPSTPTRPTAVSPPTQTTATGWSKTLTRQLGPAYRITQDGGSVYVSLRQAAFATGATQIEPSSLPPLKHAISALRHLTPVIEIEGHTDAAPSPRNAALALERAVTVASLLHHVQPDAEVSVRAVPLRPIPETHLDDESNRGVVFRISTDRP